jgi:peptidyl-prolyl cis-trans isomerase D
VVLRSTDHTLPQQKPLEAVRAEVVAAWEKQRGVELARAAAADAVKRLAAGESWAAVAKSLGQAASAPKFVSRSDQEVPYEVRTFSFSAPKPKDKPTYESVSLPNGDAAVYALSQVREDPSTEGPKDADLRQQYAARIASGESQSYAAGARAAATITLNPQAID